LSVALYLDVHVRRAVTTALRLRSVDLLTAQEDGAAEFEHARLVRRRQNLVEFFSQDDDLLHEGARLLTQHQDFSGIIYSHQLRITIGQMVEDLELIAKATSPEEWLGGGSNIGPRHPRHSLYFISNNLQPCRVARAN